MCNYYEERLREISAMLQVAEVQNTAWMKESLEAERKQILGLLED